MALTYGERKAQIAAREAAISRTGRDIGPMPKVKDAARREECARDFNRWCTTYDGGTFDLPWSRDHLQVIGIIERVVLNGGQFAIAMPRGSGKTCLCIAAATWSLLYGYHKFVLLVGSTETAADEMLQSLRQTLAENELLLADFPEVCYPIHRLDGIPHRCGGQLLDGKRTRMCWTHKEMVLPTVTGSLASGSVVRTAGIDGRIRGHQKRTDQGIIRPSLVIADDPQTRESARSRGVNSQSAQREKILAGDVLYAGQPKVKIAALMPCTVIYRGDMADNILDREKHPEWQGVRTKAMYSMPDDTAGWNYYAELRANGMRAGVDLEWATAYYEVRRAAMDAGALAAWPERFVPGEISAVQNCMNQYLKDRPAFLAEYQNEPMDDAVEQTAALEEAYLSARCVPDVAQGVVPAWADAVFITIDVGQYRLHWEASAWLLDSDTSVMIDCGIADTSVDTDGALRRVRDIQKRASLVERGIVSALDALRERFVGFAKVGSSERILPRFGVDVGGALRGDADAAAAWSSAIISYCRASGRTWHALKGARWTDGHRRRSGERNYAWSDRGFFETNSDWYKTRLYESYQRPLVARGGMVAGSRGFFAGLAATNAEYLRHQRSEVSDARGHWDRYSETLGRGKSGSQNHWWDTAYMQFVMADIARNVVQPVAATEAYVPVEVDDVRRDSLMM